MKDIKRYRALPLPEGGIRAVEAPMGAFCMYSDIAPLLQRIEEARNSAIKAIDDEPELTDEMPDDMYYKLKIMFETGDREAITEAFRIVARQTKRGIKERLKSKPIPEEVIENLKIGDTLKEYIYTVMGECIGCIEMEVAQNLNGEKIAVVTNSHGGVGYITDGATKLLKPSRFIHNDKTCTVPDEKKRGDHICNRCWMKSP